MHNFEGHIEGDRPVVVDFFADWCEPCKLLAPVLEEVREKMGERALVLRMDIDRYPQFRELYGIKSVPTIIIFRKGNVLWRKSGVASAHEIVDHLATLC